MDDLTRNEVLNKYLYAHQAYAKAMEMIGLFSAGTIGVVVALRPENSVVTIEVQTALILLFLSMIGTVFWFMGKGQQALTMANKILDDPNSEHRTLEPCWARLSRIIVLSSFILSYWLLIKSL